MVPSARTEEPITEATAERGALEKVGADGNGRDMSAFSWRDRVLGDPAPVPWFAPPSFVANDRSVVKTRVCGVENTGVYSRH